MRIDVLSLILSVLALAIASSVYINQPKSNTNLLPPSSIVSRDRPSIIERVADGDGVDLGNEVVVLEQRVQHLEAQLRNSNKENSSTEEPRGMRNVMSDMFMGIDSREDLMRARSDPDFSRQRLEELDLTIRDNNADDQERIAAMKQLYGLGMITENPNIVTEEHISEVLDIAESSTDSDTRVQAWDALSSPVALNTQSSFLVEPLTKLLTEDNNPYLRRKALSALHMRLFTSGPNGSPDNNVREAIQEAAANDEDPGIRKQATQALEQFDQIQEMMRNPQGGLISGGSGVGISTPFFSSEEAVIIEENN